MATSNVTVRINAQDNFSSTLDRLKRGLTGAADGASQAQSSLNRLQTGFDALMSSAVIAGAVRLGQEMYELGNSVRVASATFTQLAGGANEAASLMDMLRASTGGAIDNLTLMQGGTKFLSMGLAESSSEVARLTELAVKLGGAMGNDAASSINDFGLLLANESVLRLDTFGISSARVRERINELLASGEALNRSDAFRMAVLEEGGRSLDRLGISAEAAMGGMERLQVRLQNTMQDVSVAATNIVREAADTIMMLVDLAEGAATRLEGDRRRSAEIDAAAPVAAQAYTPQFQQYIASSAYMREVFSGLTDSAIQAAVEYVYQSLQTGALDIGTERNPGRISQEFLAPLMARMFPGASAAAINGSLEQNGQQAQQAYYLTAWMQDYQRALDAALRTQQRNAEIAAAMVQYRQSEINSYRDLVTAQQSASAMQGYRADERGGFAQLDINALLERANVGMQNLSNIMGGQSLFTQQDVAAANQVLFNIQALRNEAADMGMSDALVAPLTQAAEQAQQMRDFIQQGADAAKDMTLQQALFGGSDPNELLGGVMGQLLGGVDTSGWSQSTLDNLALATGEATPSSLALNRLMNTLRSRFASYGQRGADNLIGAGQTITDFLRAANIQGLGQDQIAAGLGAFETFGTGSQGQSRALAAAGLDPAALEAARTGVDSVADSLSTAVTEAERIDEALTAISSKGYDIPINFVFSGANGTLAMQIAAFIGQGTQDNNGRTPGSSTTGGRSQTVTQPVRRTRGPE